MFYDLQKAFDSVRYPVLLKCLYEAGINGRAWRLIRDWYSKPKSRVTVNGQLTPPITLERGILQGSVLSPVLFLLVMDLDIYQESKGLGPSISDTYAGAFAHADDVRIPGHSARVNQHSGNLCCSLMLNPTKCEVLLMSSSKPSPSAPAVILGNESLTIQHHAKCLGYWWSWDLSASKAINMPIKKARRAFGVMGAFHGKLNPISGKTIFDTCIIPLLLFGSENWILSPSQLDHLVAFQGEIGRRIVKLSKFHSLLSTRLALKWPSGAARVFIQKLNLFFKVTSGEESIGCCVFSSIAANDLHTHKLYKNVCRWKINWTVVVPLMLCFTLKPV